jgi:hypothetical protein
MPCYGLLLAAEFGFARVHGVDAERVEHAGDALIFWQDDRVVYRIPARYVSELATFDDRAAAVQWLRQMGRAGGGSGVLGAERQTSRGARRSPVIEHVSVVLEEPSRKPRP